MGVQYTLKLIFHANTNAGRANSLYQHKEHGNSFPVIRSDIESHVFWCTSADTVLMKSLPEDLCDKCLVVSIIFIPRAVSKCHLAMLLHWTAKLTLGGTWVCAL